MSTSAWIQNRIDVSLNSKSLAFFRITLGIWIALQALFRLIYFREIYSSEGLSPFAESIAFNSIANFNSVTHSMWMLSSGDFFTVFLLVLLFILAVLFSLGIFFPFVGWGLTFLWWQLYYRGVTLSTIADAILLYSLLWSIFLPLTEHLCLSPKWNSTRFFFKNFRAVFVLQTSIIFLFFAFNHLNQKWISGTAFETLALLEPISLVSADAVSSFSWLFKTMNYLLPLLELTIAASVLVIGLRKYSSYLIFGYAVLLLCFFHLAPVSIALSILALAFRNCNVTQARQSSLHVPEVYALLLIFLPACAYIQEVEFSSKTLISQLNDFDRKYLFFQRWNVLAEVPLQDSTVEINGQLVPERAIVTPANSFGPYSPLMRLPMSGMWRHARRKRAFDPLYVPYQNFMCRYSAYEFPKDGPFELRISKGPFSETYQVQCPR